MLYLKNSVLQNTINNCKLFVYYFIFILQNINNINNIYEVIMNYKIQLKVHYYFQ